MAISSSGIGSGLDIKSLVSQLVAAEGKPVTDSLNTRQRMTDSTLSALGTLKGAVSAFQTAVAALTGVGSAVTRAATSSNTAVMTATAASTAVTGSYSMSVEKLAQAQVLASNTGFASGDAPVGDGSLTFQMGTDPSKTFTVPIDSSNYTLAGIANAINTASDNKGVTASVVSTDDPNNPGSKLSHLVLSSNNPGLSNQMTISSTGTLQGVFDFDPAAPTASNMNQPTQASDSLVMINGMASTGSTNQLTDVIPGVTLSLVTASPGTAVNVGVAVDQTATAKTISSFVDAYNKLSSVMQSQGGYDSATKSAGALQGDSLLRSIKTQLRSDMGNPVSTASSPYNTLGSIGISIDRTGVMSLDQTQLTKALTANPNAVNDVLSSSDGVASRLNNRLRGFTQFGGPFETRTTSLNKTTHDISNSREALQRRLDQLSASLTKQFNAMDSNVATLNSTGTFLTQHFK